MKRALVTGCAGFIGSTLTERLLREGYTVTGIDVFTNNYARALKERNLERLRHHPDFTFIEQDLLNVPLTSLLSKTDVVFHQAAMPGVRQSWGQEYQEYVNCNILATQRLLEAVRHSTIDKLVYASTSSVYGVTDGPTSEEHPTRPISPYGQTKLAGEQLCQLYHHNFQVPYVALRYFTVYGPRQRSDMGFHKFIRALLLG
ncbi:MAG TPA: NAD-dependent epimerase/dehydratase family protein, partial [Bacilli bacterium]|nr:NAD-dependent epimerase/dehydratase family protein [Bacilli bacterium]